MYTIYPLPALFVWMQISMRERGNIILRVSVIQMIAQIRSRERTPDVIRKRVYNKGSFFHLTRTTSFAQIKLSERKNTFPMNTEAIPFTACIDRALLAVVRERDETVFIGPENLRGDTERIKWGIIRPKMLCWGASSDRQAQERTRQRSALNR